MTDESADRRIDDNARQLRGLIRHVQRLVAHADDDAAAVWAQVAGEFAWFNHTGAFVSLELEQALRDLGERLPSVTGSRSSAGSSPTAVLHVMTQAYQTGGPTQVLSCWLEQDRERRHRVCLTRQGSAPVPAKLLRPLVRHDDVLRLDTRRGGLMRRAEALRALARDADLVLLHTHPYDVVPLIAFADSGGLPPVVYVNHADHVFWLGTGIADVVMHMRHSGAALAADRRGVEQDRSFVMARPLRGTARTRTREEAKRLWGVEPDQVLVVTAADAAKYRPVTSLGFLDLVVPVLQKHEHAVLLAAGPSSDDAWASAARATGGRVRTLGRLPDVSALHEAADVYVDSFPFSSLTSLLEAGSVGTPAVTFRGHDESCGVLGTDIPGVDEHLMTPADVASFEDQLGALLEDEQGRHRTGDAVAEAIRSTHTGEGWRGSVNALYEAAGRQRGAVVPPPAPGLERREELDRLVEMVMHQTMYAEGVVGAVRDHLGLMPLDRRLAASAILLATGRPPRLRDLLPEHHRPALAEATRRVRSLRQRERPAMA